MANRNKSDDQKTLMMAVAEAKQICNSLNIPINKVDEFSVNYRAKTRWGQCKTWRNGDRVIRRTINISADLVNPANDCHNGLVSTLVHELLHTCDNCNCHTGEWKRYAGIVNKAYGAKGVSITRCKSAKDLGVTTTDKSINQYKYGVTCPKCGMTVKYMKRSKAVMHPEMFRCGRCGAGNLYTVSYGASAKETLNNKRNKEEFRTPYTETLVRMTAEGYSEKAISEYLRELYYNGKIYYGEWMALKDYAEKKARAMA